MCGSHCFPDLTFHSLNKQPPEAIGAGGDITCPDVFSSQLQEVVLDLGVSDPAAGRTVASCGNKTSPHQCGSPRAVLPAQLESHQPHNGWCSPGLFHGFHALCQGGLKAAALTSSFPLTRPSSRNTQQYSLAPGLRSLEGNPIILGRTEANSKQENWSQVTCLNQSCQQKSVGKRQWLFSLKPAYRIWKATIGKRGFPVWIPFRKLLGR